MLFLFSLSLSEPKSNVSPQFLQLVQEFLNLYNTSHPSPKFQEKLQSHLFNSLQQMPNAHLLTLPIISAGMCVYDSEGDRQWVVPMRWSIAVSNLKVEPGNCHLTLIIKVFLSLLQQGIKTVCLPLCEVCDCVHCACVLVCVCPGGFFSLYSGTTDEIQSLDL